MNTEELKDYLKHIYGLEVSLYNQRRMQMYINDEIQKYSNARYEREEPYYDESIDEDFWIENLKTRLFPSSVFGAILGVCLFVVVGIITIFDTWSFNFFSFATAFKFMLACVVIMYGWGTIADLRDKYHNKKINRKKFRQNGAIRERNNRLLDINRQKVDILQKELSSLVQLYRETSEVLNLYYDKNIIFPKYRNFVAIASFYEYFCTKRCNSLEGHEGAYNKFEEEIRQNIIIAKLDEVISRLETIENNQYMLYSAIRESNRKVDQLYGEISQSVERLDQIENNTSIIAYNSTITAQNTEFLKWVNYCRI